MNFQKVAALTLGAALSTSSAAFSMVANKSRKKTTGTPFLAEVTKVNDTILYSEDGTSTYVRSLHLSWEEDGSHYFTTAHDPFFDHAVGDAISVARSLDDPNSVMLIKSTQRVKGLELMSGVLAAAGALSFVAGTKK